MGTKIADLTEMTSLSGNDLLLIENNNGNGTYTSQKIQVSNFKGEWQLVERKEFAAPATSYTFTGLNGDVDRRYKVVTNIVVANTQTGGILMYANSDTGNNYKGGWFDFSYASNAHDGGAADYSGIVLAWVGADVIGTISTTEIFAKTGTVRRYMSSALPTKSGALYLRSFPGGFWTNTTDNITSFTCSFGTNGIGIGSYIELWKLAQ